VSRLRCIDALFIYLKKDVSGCWELASQAVALRPEFGGSIGNRVTEKHPQRS
jgi:hypothetical protein